MIRQFQHNEEMHQWERVDRVQEYKGHTIETITCHGEYSDPLNIKNHREYRVTSPDGRVSYRRINKREGGNIKDLMEYIDFKERYGG